MKEGKVNDKVNISLCSIIFNLILFCCNEEIDNAFGI
jgi:hypothetical protein